MRAFLHKLRAVRRTILPDNRSSEAFRQALASLTAGDVAVDCGANLGIYTEMMARSGATVHSFEPDPAVFAELERKFRNVPNVVLHHAAVSSRAGIAKLYFHSDRDNDPVKMSQSSSLEVSKTNIDPGNYHEVATLDLSAFVAATGFVKLLKMDIEGHEIEVINHLIDTGEIKRIDRAFVELHDRKNPSLKEATDALRERIAEIDVDFDLTWH